MDFSAFIMSKKCCNFATKLKKMKAKQYNIKEDSTSYAAESAAIYDHGSSKNDGLGTTSQPCDTAIEESGRLTVEEFFEEFFLFIISFLNHF